MSENNESEELRNKLSDKISAARDRLKKIIKEIKEIEFEFYPLPEVSNPRKIAALDGGGYSQDYVGITVIPSRAAGAIFEKDKERGIEILKRIGGGSR